jgi:hypothetical protein
MTVQASSAKARGTVLLEEFERFVPRIDGFDDGELFEFITAIHLVVHYFQITKRKFERKQLSQSASLVACLRELRAEYAGKNESFAFAIFVVSAHFESHYLDGPDAKLVHDLTALHIYRPFPLGSAAPLIAAGHGDPGARSADR